MNLPEIHWATYRALFVLPLLILLVLWAFGNRRTRQPISDSSRILRRWITQSGLAEHPPRLRRAWRGVLFCIGLLLVGLGLARPQWGEIQEQSFEQQREILVALDLSQSMLAEDVSPSRLARSKLLVEGLLDALRGERVGLALFAGTAFLQSPLSADHEVMRDLLTDLDPTYIPQGGTNYRALFDTALGAFSDGEADRFLVILSDGEAHDPGWKERIPELRKRGIRVISLGVGTADGGVVPDASGGYLKDARGAVVLSRLTPATLEALARRTGGVYEDAAVWVDIADLIEQTVARGTKGAFSEQKAPPLVERSQYFLGPALLFLLLGYLFELPVPPHARKLGGPEESATRQTFFETPVLVLLAVLLSSALAHAATPVKPATPANPKAPEPPALVKIIGALSEKPEPAAKDYASMAEETLRYAGKSATESKSTLRSVIDDALAAVDRGESLDPKAASWKELREKLISLRDRLDRANPDKSQQSSSSQNEQDKKQGKKQEPSQAEQNSKPSSGQGDKEKSKESKQGQQGQQGKQGEPDNAKSEGQGSSAKQGEKQKGSESSQAGSTEPKQLNDKKSGLGSLDEKKHQEQKQEKGLAQQPQKPAGGSRVVGGGAGREQELNQQHPELSEALGKMRGVVDADSPATLYQRMQGKRDGSPKRAEGKNW